MSLVFHLNYVFNSNDCFIDSGVNVHVSSLYQETIYIRKQVWQMRA